MVDLTCTLQKRHGCGHEPHVSLGSISRGTITTRRRQGANKKIKTSPRLIKPQLRKGRARAKRRSHNQNNQRQMPLLLLHLLFLSPRPKGPGARRTIRLTNSLHPHLLPHHHLNHRLLHHHHHILLLIHLQLNHHLPFLLTHRQVSLLLLHPQPCHLPPRY